MYLHFYRVHRRLAVNLVASRRVDGKVRSEHLGRLGSILLAEPLTLEERLRFWAGLAARFGAVDARFPNRVTADIRRKILAALAARIPTPISSEEHRILIASGHAEALKRGAGDDAHEPLRKWVEA
jgi:hypothetical protein